MADRVSPVPPERTTTVRIEDGGNGVAIVVLDRPAALNAISAELVEDFGTALDHLLARRPRFRCLMLTGTGRAFCSGGDISVHRDRPPAAEPLDLADVLHNAFNPLLLRLLRLPIPFITAINGAAAGAGCPLALAGDIVVAAQSASFQCGFQRIGLLPDLGATWLLPRLVGRARAHAMLLLDRRIDAQTAMQWGLIYDVVPDGQLRDEALATAARLAAASIPAIVGTRRATLAAMGGSLQEALDAEANLQRGLGFSGDFAEGIRAFFEKRAPVFGDY